ncbi:DUF3727 domain-containing protein [Tumidithrix elongata RA019]|uniref:DUF3727 domain-containing protein n=1 Tax=Tumidithrix elongata BACA0141 TaxID=2716417 RepID=A0AAW9Q0N3_9CYAN|nr:DUF3727 domain-containing protein [Tumidithrix elongata RA019]
MDGSTLILTDDAGKSLPCFLETTFDIEGKEYFLLQPVDHSVQIFAWQASETEEEEEELVDIDDDEIDQIFETAHAVLAEQNLKLKRTAFTLTVEGELPELIEDDIYEIGIGTEEEGECEEFQELANFYHEEQAYSVFTSVDPLIFFAKLGADGKPELLSPEEIEYIQPYVAEHLIDAEDAEEEA